MANTLELKKVISSTGTKGKATILISFEDVDEKDISTYKFFLESCAKYLFSLIPS